MYMRISQHIHRFPERGEFEPERTDDEFLIKFLRARFFKLEHAYTLVYVGFGPSQQTQHTHPSMQ